nr:PREDICTED: glucose dehydrogenase [FAD, quinone]-like [Bemisia tabaci]
MVAFRDAVQVAAVLAFILTQCTSGEEATARQKRGGLAMLSFGQKQQVVQETETVTTTTTTKVVRRNDVFGYNERMSKPPPPVSVCRRYGYDSEGLYSIKAFTKLLESLNKAQCDIVQEIIYPADNSLSLRDDDTADYIVVGLGVAGSVIASRLSEIPSNSVIGLEAGGNPSLITEFPRLWTEAADTEYEWNYRLRADNYSCLSSEYQRGKLYKGRGLGGTSAIDLMIYDRCMTSDYEKFNEIGLPDWGYEACLKYYMKSEDARCEEIFTKVTTIRASHNSGGLLTVDSFYNSQTVSIRKSFGQCISELGMTSKDVFTEIDHDGFAPSLALIKDGLRVNVARAFLSPREVRRRPNLKVCKFSYVTRLLLDDANTKVIGVEFRNRLGDLVKLYCNKEVILTAGAIESPHVLQNSGIGDPVDLARVGTILRKERPGVGKNLQMHPLFPGAIMTFKTPPIAQWPVGDMLYELIAHRKGPITNIGLTSYTGFVKTNTSDVPNLQIIPYYFSKEDSLFLNGQLAVFGYDEATRKKIREINRESSIAMFGVSLLYPKSVGSVYPETSNPYDHPVIDAKLLSDPEDIYSVLGGIDWVRGLEDSPVFQKFGAKFLPLYVDNCLYPIGSREYWMEAVRHLTVPRKHPVGTCKMGLPDDPLAVVDPDFRFIGLDNLRIGDSSILPRIFSSDSSAVTVMIAEKCADRIMSQI